MSLDARGNVLACCQNVWEPLGNITEQSLTDIWWGEAAQRLREAVQTLPLPPGCRFCQWQIDDEAATGPFSAIFDHYPVTHPLGLPAVIEFALSNRCNLRCAMCNGEWSSSIRSRREGLPALPAVYDDRFFADLEAFLPSLSLARFLGGEPFLIREHQRVWDLMADVGPDVECHVTTNGTVWNERVEEVLDTLPMSVTVSIDGLSPEVFEAVRAGASHAQVLLNLERFRRHCSGRGQTVDIAFCLMRQNWHEFGDLLAWATAEDLRVFVNTVTHPAFSLFTLDQPELRKAVEGMEAQSAALEEGLGRNRQVWRDELDRLRRRLDAVEAGSPRLYFDPPALTPDDVDLATAVTGGPAWTDPGPAAEARSVLDGWTGLDALGWVTIDTAGRIVGAGGEDGFLAIPATDLVGTPASTLIARLRDRHGGTLHQLRQETTERWEDTLLVMAGDRATFVRLLAWDRLARDGTPRGRVVHAALDVQSGTDVLAAGYRAD